jgi:hypothetical protein
MRATGLLCSLVLLFLLHCASTDADPVAVTGDAAELSALTGEWSGSYESRATGRSGSIVFHLTGDESGAHGDVVMMAPGAMTRDAHAQTGEPAAHSQVIGIRFVRLAGKDISGEMEPYNDPVTNAQLHTRFVGKLEGDTIRGTFETTGGEAAAPARGTWKVKRSG